MSTKRKASDALLNFNMKAKYERLMEEYEFIQQEFGEFKARLQAANMKKTSLYAEVRFLRCKGKKHKKMPSDLKENQTVQATFQCALQNCDGKTYSQTLVQPSSVPSAKTDWRILFVDREPLNHIIANNELLSSQKISVLNNISNPNLAEPAKKRKASSMIKTPNPNCTAPVKRRTPNPKRRMFLDPDPINPILDNIGLLSSQKISVLNNICNPNLTEPAKRRKASSAIKTPNPNCTAAAAEKKTSNPNCRAPAKKKSVS